MHLQKHCVVIFERVFRQDEHFNSLVSDVSSLSMCHNNKQYSFPELFIPEFALPISTTVNILKIRKSKVRKLAAILPRHALKIRFI